MKHIALFFFLIQFSCSHVDREFDSHISNQRCDEAAQHLPGSTPLDRTAKTVKYIANNIAAYTYITANYTTEVLWDVTTGTVIVVGLCGPVIAASIASHSSGQPLSCIPVNGNSLHSLMAPPLGRRAVEKTQNLRCPDLTAVSQSLQKVATCYEKKGDNDSLHKAIKSLENIESSKDFFSCLEAEDQAAIISHRTDLQEKVSKL